MSKITYEDLNRVNTILQERDDESTVAGGNALLDAMGVKGRFSQGEPAKAGEFIKKAVYEFLEREDYISAAVLMFGFDYFDPRNDQAKDIFRCATEYDEVVTFGASSMSKTWAFGIWCVCDYLRDPYFTNIIVASVGETHLKGNLFSNLISAVQNSIIDLNLETKISSMKIAPADAKTEDAGIYGKTFPQDKQFSTGRIRGIKPVKRGNKEHPKFGKSGRVRILLDEASNIPEGCYLDFGSAMSSNDGNGRVKFFVAFNPTIVEHWTTKISQPVGGIELIDEDNDIEWTSEQGWHVYRLDGMRSPNVIEKKKVCEGMMTWEAMKRKIASGENSMDYWVYGRGMWMRKGHFSNVIPMDKLTSNRGELIFPEGSENVASIDVAFATDKVIFTLGRWGRASGFMKPDGEKEIFMHEGNTIVRHALQYDQQFEIDIPTSDTIKLSNEILRLAKDLKVTAEWLVIDRTAIGKGVFDTLVTYFGPVLGINWQEKATEYKVMAENEDIAYDLYANIGTEMWFAMKEWLDRGVIKIGTAISANPLFTELTTRRYKPRGTRVIVESKPDYKARSPGGASPDRADSSIMLPQLCRMRGDALPSITGKEEGAGGDWNMGQFEESDGLEEVDSLALRDNEDNNFPAITGHWDYGA